MKLRAVINADAGGLTDQSADELADRLVTRMRDIGWSIDFDLTDAAQLNSAIEIATQRQDINAVIVAGGDGSVRCAAEQLVGRPVALGILPLGTLNRLARDLKIPLDVTASIQALTNSEPQEIDVAKVNSRVFLCNSILGLAPHIVRKRQSLRGRPLISRVGGYFETTANMLQEQERLDLSVQADHGQTQHLEVVSAAISNNLYTSEPGLFQSRGIPNRGLLGLYASQHSSLLGTLMSAVKTRLGDWEQNEEFASMQAQTFKISMNEREFDVCNDGEIETMKMPLTYTSLPRALKVLVPKGAKS